ncbi:MAG: hypothetical protein ACYC9O_18140, partial [Candidatus Latescibacterota bacterium]
TIPSGASIHVTSIVANYERGLSVDILDAGNSNDLNKVVVIGKSTVIRVFKDAFPCGEVHIDVARSPGPERSAPVSVSAPFQITHFEIRAFGKNLIVSEGDTLHIIRGDLLEIVDARAADKTWTDFRINFVGFVGNNKENDAEDRGYSIDTASDLIPRFSIDGAGEYYKIEALNGSRIAGSMYVKLDNPRVDYLIAERGDGARLALSPGSTVSCSESEPIKLLSVVSNVSDSPLISLLVTHGKEQGKEVILPAPVAIRGNTEVQFRRNSTTIGSILFRADR